MAVTGLLGLGFGPTGSGAGPQPDKPTLTIVDNADGTGAVATIAGSTAGSTNEVFTQAISGGLGTAPEVSGGSRIGDGTVALSLTNGYYWANVVSTVNNCDAVSAAVYFLTTSGIDAVFKQCLDAVGAVIQGLVLTGISNTDVYVRKLPWNRNAVTPGIFITPKTETTIERANQTDDFGYGVQVTVVQKSNQNLTANLGAELLWRQQIRNAFIEQRLTAVEEVYSVTYEPGSVILPEGFAAMYDVQAMIFRCKTRELTR